VALVLKAPRVGRPAAVLAGILVVVLLAFVAFRLWDRSVEDRLGRWAAADVERRTGGAYRLTVGDVTFLPFDGSLSFDSATVLTDTAVNHRRAEPLPTLDWRSRGCRITGVDGLRLLLRRTLAARELGCDRVAMRIGLTPHERERRTPNDSAQADSALAELPKSLGLASVRIARITLPAVRFALHRPGADGGSSVLLDSARFEAAEVEFDPRATPESGNRLSASRARLSARGVVLTPDTATTISIGALTADFPDSTLRLARLRHEPDVPEDEWVRRLKVRKDRIRFEADSLRGRGVTFRAFLATGEIGAHALEIHGGRLDVLTDRRIPPAPPRRHHTPQQLAADPGAALRIDTVLVRNATIAYRERKPEVGDAGRVTFERARGRVLHLHAPAGGRPLRIEAEARVMGEGPLTAEAEVPLDAPDFRYELSATLGPMPARAFNRFLSTNEAFEFDKGEIEGVTVHQTVRNGLATTMVTPRYHDLSVKPTGDGGGLVGSVTRRVKKFIANAFVVRDRNPDKDGKDLRTARTQRVYDPTKTWVQFVWLGVRDAAMEGMKE
jgi:hypothetical protein